MKSKQTDTRSKPAPARKPGAEPKKPPARKPLVGNSHAELTAEEIERMIATEAYLRAEKRGFEAGHELEDWVAAEREVREKLAGGRSRALQ